VSLRVSIRVAGQEDLREIHAWYERQRAGLGDEFLVAVADALSRLEENPVRFPIYYREFRRVLTERFPYRLFFRIEKDGVIVFRILHVARDHVRQLR
jgi:plasmid stabilization system protein ParE